MRLFPQLVVSLTLASCIFTCAAFAQDPAEKDILEQSLPLRTALYHDATLETPLQQLVTLFRSQNRLEELVTIYRNHTTQYPKDESGRTVFVRLLIAANNPTAEASVAAASKAFPQNSYLHYLLFSARSKKHDPRAIDSLDKAIQLEQRPNRRTIWVDQLLKQSVAAGRNDLAEKSLLRLAEDAKQPHDRLDVARKMNRYKFPQHALELLDSPSDTSPNPETMVSIQLEASTSEIALKKNEEAAKRLDALLQKLTADYWRRSEIVSRRLALLKTRAEREEMIADAQKRLEQRPSDEAAVLDLVQVLVGLQHRRQALDVLKDASERIPKSEAIERELIDLLDRLHDQQGKQEYLAKRLAAQPNRQDLALMRIKSLFQIGNGKEARKHWDELLSNLPEQQRADSTLEMARYLRQSQLLTDATKTFESVLEMDPERLTVRRELAELHLALGNRLKMKEVLGQPLPDDAPIESVLDLVQFMIREKTYVEAQAVLEEQRQSDTKNLEIRLLLVDLSRRLGDLATGEQLLTDSRLLADTSAKYRRWLEAGVALHEEFETLTNFLRTEFTGLRSESERWSEKWLERHLVFVDVAARDEMQAEVVAWLKKELDADPPKNVRAQLRQKLIAAIENDTKQSETLQQQLKLLAESQPDLQSEVNARLVMLHIKQKRHDLATPLLGKIDIQKIKDPALLTGLLSVVRTNQYDAKKIIQILRRITEVNPTNRQNWQQWLTHLAATHDEVQLRTALRRLMAGIEKMEISEETRQDLKGRLVDSYWRTISRNLVSGKSDKLIESVSLLEAVEPMVASDLQWSWVAWIRAYVLKNLDRPDAATEAIDEWERVASSLSGETHDAQSPKQMCAIPFPDGISISLEHARTMLENSADINNTPADKPNSRSAPLPPYATKWIFESNSGTTIAAVTPTDSVCLLLDTAGNAYGIDIHTGKAIWQQSSIVAAVHSPQSTRQVYIQNPFGNGYYQNVKIDSAKTRSPVVIGDRFIVAQKDEIACHSLADGSVIWRAYVGATSAAIPDSNTSLVSVIPYAGQLLTFEPRSGTLTRVDIQTGKVVWDTSFPPPNPTIPNFWNSGISLHGDQLLFYGGQTGVFDLKTNELVWSFEPWRLKPFPVKLQSMADTAAATTASSASRGPRVFGMGAPTAGGFFGHQMQSYPGALQVAQGQSTYVNYLQPTHTHIQPQSKITLTSPAVAWAANSHMGIQRSAELFEHSMALVDQSGMLLVNTQLPLSGKRVNFSGKFVGMAGRTAVSIYGNNLYLTNANDGTSKNISLQDLTDTNQFPWFDVTMDGALAFISGPRGIWCFNLISGQQLFKATPRDAQLAGTEKELTPEQLQIRQQLQNSYGGVSQVSKIGRIQDGVIYALRSQGQLVAIQRKSS